MGEIQIAYLEKSIRGWPGTPICIDIAQVSTRTISALTLHHLYTFQSNSECHIKFGDASVVATADDFRMAKDWPYSFTPGSEDNLYVAAIRSAVGPGILQITPMYKG